MNCEPNAFVYFLGPFGKKGSKVSLNDRFYKVLRMRIPQLRFIYKPNAFLMIWRASVEKIFAKSYGSGGLPIFPRFFS